ncbi:Uncharacterized protein Fot_34831 [Forsythia ovata]|uniref:Uncharacterized protein n=1 Tax=Forsythia ovata TaxID=205694 RepID=A0ABD1SKU7_9LAMI
MPNPGTSILVFLDTGYLNLGSFSRFFGGPVFLRIVGISSLLWRILLLVCATVQSFGGYSLFSFVWWLFLLALKMLLFLFWWLFNLLNPYVNILRFHTELFQESSEGLGWCHCLQTEMEILVVKVKGYYWKKTNSQESHIVVMEKLISSLSLCLGELRWRFIILWGGVINLLFTAATFAMVIETFPSLCSTYRNVDILRSFYMMPQLVLYKVQLNFYSGFSREQRLLNVASSNLLKFIVVCYGLGQTTVPDILGGGEAVSLHCLPGSCPSDYNNSFSSGEVVQLLLASVLMDYFYLRSLDYLCYDRGGFLGAVGSLYVFSPPCKVWVTCDGGVGWETAG